jgi:hypothetical protein
VLQLLRLLPYSQTLDYIGKAYWVHSDVTNKIKCCDYESGLTRKRKTRLKSPTRGKHTSLFDPLVSYDVKSF